MYKSLFEDFNELKILIHDADLKSLAALSVFIDYLDLLECNADAWRMRLITKQKFPDASINTDKPELPVPFAIPRTLPTNPDYLIFISSSAPQDVDYSITTLAALINVSFHQKSHTSVPLSPIVHDIKPCRETTCCAYNSACAIRIFADDLRDGMVFIYLFSDTLARKHEDIDARTWSDEVQQKSGISYGTLFVIHGPLQAGKKEFNVHIRNHISDMSRFINKQLSEETILLPGRSFTVIHKRNKSKFKTLYGTHFENHPRTIITIKNGGRLHLEKNTLTGVYELELFDARV